MGLVLREARMSDAGLLWRWANDRETRESSFTRTPIPYADHVAWLTCRLGSDATRMWIFAEEEVPVGQVRFDISGEVAEIGITVAPEHRGRGYGRVMLAQAIRRLREEKGDWLKPRASVLAHNAASLRLFKACGFEEIGTDRRNGEQVVVLELTGMVS
jgi:UDP-2,4-diacetamido-2,4,6-trideoxy-beta-L-altropyranose hydrolase